MPDEQPKSERMTEEQKSRSLGYLRSVLIEEERRNSQVIPLPEEVAPLPPPVAAPSPATSHETSERWTRSNTVTLIVFVGGCFAIGAFFFINFLMSGEIPTSHDRWMAAGALFVLMFVRSLETREERQREHFETIERELAEIKSSLSKRA